MRAVCGLVYKYGIPRKAIPDNMNLAPFLIIDGEASVRRESFTDVEIEKIKKACGKVPHAEDIYCMIYTGFRPSEFLALTADSYDKTESKLFENVVKNITDGYVTDYGKIFEYANSTGLTRERAELAAKSGYEAIIQRLREKVLVGITKYHYGEYGTYKYALALGLPEQMARELAEHALRVNEKDILESEHLGKLQ